MKKIKIPYIQYHTYKMCSGYINGLKAQFIIDLNREYSVLNQAYFYRSGKKEGKKYLKRERTIEISKLNFFSLQFENLVFPIENLYEYEEFGKTVYGILGSDLFKDFSLEIDEKEQLYIIS